MREITVHSVADDFQDCFDMKFSLFPTQWIFFLSSKVKVHIVYCIMCKLHWLSQVNKYNSAAPQTAYKFYKADRRVIRRKGKKEYASRR